MDETEPQDLETTATDLKIEIIKTWQDAARRTPMIRANTPTGIQGVKCVST